MSEIVRVVRKYSVFIFEYIYWKWKTHGIATINHFAQFMVYSEMLYSLRIHSSPIGIFTMSYVEVSNHMEIFCCSNYNNNNNINTNKTSKICKSITMHVFRTFYEVCLFYFSVEKKISAVFVCVCVSVLRLYTNLNSTYWIRNSQIVLKTKAHKIGKRHRNDDNQS